MLSQKALQDFQRIWQEEFGEKISDDSATEEAVNLLTLIDKTYHSIKKEWLEEFPVQVEKLDKGN